MKEATFGIGIPTLNRIDLLLPSLHLYTKDYFGIDIFVIDNGSQDTSKIPSSINLIKSGKNLGVGASWNVLCEKIFENNSNALILNDDIYLGNSKENIINLIKTKGNAFLTATPDWCAFIVSKKIFNTVGKFDECFYPAYYEDNSYAYRMKMKRVPHIKTPLLNPYIYRASQTLEKDFSILEARKKNKELYIKMWGGEPLKEKFLTPYNG
jgi:hypothetical protein